MPSPVCSNSQDMQQRVNPALRTLVTLRCQCSFISFNISLQGEAEMGEARLVKGQGIYGNSLPSIQFCCNPNLL